MQLPFRIFFLNYRIHLVASIPKAELLFMHMELFARAGNGTRLAYDRKFDLRALVNGYCKENATGSFFDLKSYFI